MLKGEAPFTERPNAHLTPVDFDSEFNAFKRRFDRHQTFLDFLSFLLYPQVFEDYWNFKQEFGDVSALPTPAFFYGMRPGEEIMIEIAPGKTIHVRLMFIGEPDDHGMRTVFFKLNGQTRGIDTRDRSVQVESVQHRKAEADHHVGSPLQGKLARVLVEAGQDVEANEPLFVIEAMKMESTVVSPAAGTVAAVVLGAGEMVEQDDLVIELDG